MTLTRQELVEAFRDREAAQDIQPLTTSAELCTMLTAWRNVRLRFENGPTEFSAPTPQAWRDLWANTHFEGSDAQDALGGTVADANRVLRQIVAHRLVYPDGTVHRMGERYVAATMVARLNPKKAAG